MSEKQLMNQVYQAFINNGLSPNQARAFTAEVGRENDFNPKFLFGSHGDMANKKTNLGFISWQGKRRENLIKFMQQRGLMNDDGSMKQGQASLDAQAKFLIDEIKNTPDYKETRDKVLSNPNVDYETANRVIGKNFIRWDYDGNSLGKSVSKHHAKRDNYYQQLGGASAMPDYSAFAGPGAEVPKVRMAQSSVDGVELPNQATRRETVLDFSQSSDKALETAQKALIKPQTDYVDSLKIQTLDFEPSEYDEQLAQAFGDYPDMSGAIG